MDVGDGKGCLVVILVAVAMYVYAFLIPSDSRIAEWPQELESEKAASCHVYSYRNCSKGDWFGTVNEPLSPSQLASGNLGKSTRLMSEVCTNTNDFTDENNFRAIYVEDNWVVLLCRMKSPEDIDRGTVLAELEKLAP